MFDVVKVVIFLSFAKCFCIYFCFSSLFFSFYLLYRRTAAPLRPLIPYNVVRCAIVERLERDEEEKK